MNVLDNLTKVQKQIKEAELRGGRPPGSVKLLPVTKTVPQQYITQVMEAGIVDFGENRVQELVEKYRHFPKANWHMIGHLQTNKVKKLLGKTVLIHSLDRWSLAEKINSLSLSNNIKTKVLVQVNVSGEKSKYGLNPLELEDFIYHAIDLEGIEIQGLMTMAPFVDKPEEVRPVFRELARWRDKLASRWPGIRILSMGMTNDFTVAIEEGADIVRVGSAIFRRQTL
nr:YggS family pyridoxal phosphate-dependent enzyme [Desulfofalx alkaliphila]